MFPPQTWIDTLAAFSYELAFATFLALNVFIFFASLLTGAVIRKLFAHKAITQPHKPTAFEWLLSCATVVLNALVALLGWTLWKHGYVVFRTDMSWRIAVDAIVLFLLMDIAMYVLHRLAHHPLFFRWAHALHHKYQNPHPITLFVLHPLENLGFGLLWLSVIFVYPSSWIGMMIYLQLNVWFGLLGHTGVEPLPAFWSRIPVLSWLSTSTFHAQHHHNPSRNYGFYFIIWDRLMGTLQEKYNQRIGKRIDDQ